MRDLLVILSQEAYKQITPGEATTSFFKGLGEALLMVKKGFFTIAPELMSMLGEFWVFLIPTALFFVVTVLFFVKGMFKGF